MVAVEPPLVSLMVGEWRVSAPFRGEAKAAAIEKHFIFKSIPPALLSFQQFPVGRNFDVQGQLDVHQLLVLAHLAGHVMLGSLQSVLQVPDAELGVLHCQLTTLLSLCDLGLKAGPL